MGAGITENLTEAGRVKSYQLQLLGHKNTPGFQEEKTDFKLQVLVLMSPTTLAAVQQAPACPSRAMPGLLCAVVHPQLHTPRLLRNVLPTEICWVTE